ncbi:MAG: AAA family ATPase [Candidatus Thermoplasmatota archaeon]|nr:AAA family ATPase [Candidatus Thermoplasmatota archaeon]
MENTSEDWSERYRPERMDALVGNDGPRKRIETWLHSWSKGTPERKGILLVGPPGIGKTTIALATAAEFGWNVVELNASEQRNAAVLRRAAMSGAVHSSLDSWSSSGQDTSRTLILLDEVDHLGGSFRKVSEKRIEQSFDAEMEGGLKGDSGGKAELLRILEETQQPVIMTCNDKMRLYGRSDWRTNETRIRKFADIIEFRRVTAMNLETIARRVLKEEGVSIDGPALDAMVRNNSGDIRALINDLQCAVENGHINLQSALDQIEIGRRDAHVEVFEGVKRMFEAPTNRDAASVARELDRSPSELRTWLSWTTTINRSEHNNLAMAIRALKRAEWSHRQTFASSAYRAWYWTYELMGAAARAPGQKSRPDVSYPDTLRRGREGWTTGSANQILSEAVGTSHAAGRESLYPILLAMHEDRMAGDPEDIGLSQRIGLMAEDHLALHGIRRTSSQGKKILERFSLEIETDTNPMELPSEDTTVEDSDKSESKETTGTQFSLDSF